MTGASAPDEPWLLWEERARFITEIRRLRAELRMFTDDTCYGLCDSPAGLLEWFTRETRGLLGAPEAHDILDLVLNKVGHSELTVAR